MSTTKRFQEELEALIARASDDAGFGGSIGDQHLAQEKLSEAKAAFERLRERGDDAVGRLVQCGDEAWSEFTEKLRDVRSFIESRLGRSGEGEGEGEGEQ